MWATANSILLCTTVTLHSHTLQGTPYVQVCLHGIITPKREMKTVILSQSKSKLRYQHDLVSDIIYRKHAHLSPPLSPPFNDIGHYPS
jgi:hypothetical protein